MAELAYRRYGNFPQRQATRLPRAAKRRAQFALEAMYFETDSSLATTVAVPSHTTEQPGSTRFCGMQMESSWSRQGEAKMATSSSEHLQRHCVLSSGDQSIAATLRRIRIHPQAQRILGNSRIATVCVERLRVQGQVEPDQLLTTLQPVVVLVRLPCQAHSQLHNVDVKVSSLEDHSQQNGFCQNIEESSKRIEASTPPKAAEPSCVERATTAAPYWTEPFSPDAPKAAQPSCVEQSERAAPYWTEPFSPDAPKAAQPSCVEQSERAAPYWTEPFSPDAPKAAQPSFSPDAPKAAEPSFVKRSTTAAPYWTEAFSPDAPKPAQPSCVEQSERAAPYWTEPVSPDAPKPAEPSCVEQSERAAPYWTEPFSPDASSPTGQDLQQESGLNVDSNSGPLYIHFESVWNVKTDSEQSDLDPEPVLNLVLELDPESESSHLGSEQNMVIESDSGPEDCVVIESDPESHSSHQGPEQHMILELDPEYEYKCESEAEPACRGNSCSLTQQGSAVSCQQSECGDGIRETESEDFCAVCLNGGDLLCCDRCPKVYHLACHLPPLLSFPLGDWVCTLCRTDQDPAETYECENTHSYGGVKAPYTLSNPNQRRCEKLTLLLSCHMLSAPFHEPVSPQARNYYQTIKRPIDLSVIRRKLDKGNTLHYFTPEQFVDDVLLMFKNCATFNYPDSEVAQAGRKLEVFFLSKLKEIFPDQTFPTASEDRTDTGWLTGKRKDNYRKKRHVLSSGKRYYL